MRCASGRPEPLDEAWPWPGPRDRSKSERGHNAMDLVSRADHATPTQCHQFHRQIWPTAAELARTAPVNSLDSHSGLASEDLRPDVHSIHRASTNEDRVTRPDQHRLRRTVRRTPPRRRQRDAPRSELPPTLHLQGRNPPPDHDASRPRFGANPNNEVAGGSLRCTGSLVPSALPWHRGTSRHTGGPLSTQWPCSSMCG